MPRTHIHGSLRRIYYGLNRTDDPRNVNFRSPIRMHYIRIFKYYYVWLRMQYGNLQTNTDCHECTSVANPASHPGMCDLGITLYRRVYAWRAGWRKGRGWKSSDCDFALQKKDILFYIYTMFPAARAVAVARNVARWVFAIFVFDIEFC